MTSAESAALERFIVAVKAHPLALIHSNEEINGYEADIRRMADGGMTRREAVQIVEALDTESERTQIRGILKVLVSMSDTNTLTNMLLRLCQEALAKQEEPVVVPNPPPVDNSEKPTEDAATEVITGPRITSVKNAGGEHISVTVEGWDHWPSKGSKGKTVRGRLCIGTKAKPSGEMVDYMTGSQMRGGRKTMGNAFGSGEHSLDVEKGETVQVWVESLDKKQRTPKVPFIWPWKST